MGLSARQGQRHGCIMATRQVALLSPASSQQGAPVLTPCSQLHSVMHIQRSCVLSCLPVRGNAQFSVSLHVTCCAGRHAQAGCHTRMTRLCISLDLLQLWLASWLAAALNRQHCLLSRHALQQSSSSPAAAQLGAPLAAAASAACWLHSQAQVALFPTKQAASIMRLCSTSPQPRLSCL